MYDLRSRYNEKCTNMKERLSSFFDSIRTILNKEKFYVCGNCEYCVGDEMISNIKHENSEYEKMTDEEVAEIIGNCEYRYTLKEQYEMNFWCPFYIPNMEYLNETEKKLVFSKLKK